MAPNTSENETAKAQASAPPPGQPVIPLTEAVKKHPDHLLHRLTSSMSEKMSNFEANSDHPEGLPMKFWCHWDLDSRPRRMALLLDDCQEEYRTFAETFGILENLQTLTETFRDKRAESEVNANGVAVVWCAWSRAYDDKISNAMDRWYGPQGVHPDKYENALYVLGGEDGLKTLSELAPTEKEIADGWLYRSSHLDMFWTFTSQGKSYLDEKLKSLDIDTVVIAGLWTDECIVATAYAALSRGYDVVVVSDGVATATTNHDIALRVLGGTCAKVLTTQQIVDYMQSNFELGEPGAVKGKKHEDGRKE